MSLDLLHIVCLVTWTICHHLDVTLHLRYPLGPLLFENGRLFDAWSFEAMSWVENVKGERSSGDHASEVWSAFVAYDDFEEIFEYNLHRFKNDKLRFIAHDRVTPTTLELSNTIGTPDQNRDESDDSGTEE